MKAKALVVTSALLLSVSVAGYAAIGDRYKLAIDSQAMKCHKVAQRVIADDADFRLLGVSTVEGYSKTVTMKFVITSVFGATVDSHFRCGFDDSVDDRQLTSLSVNGYTYSHDQVFMLDVLSDL